MAGDAGLSNEEIEILRKEDGHRKAWTRDYMLMFFWVCCLSLVVLTLDSGIDVFAWLYSVQGD